MKFEGWQTSGHLEKPIHHWIEYRKGEPIPEDIKFDGWQKSKGFDGCKPIHYWIKYRPGEPIPEDMKIDGW